MVPLDVLGTRLRQAREESRLTKQDVADKTPISVERLDALEAGAEEPYIDEAADLARLYGISIDDLADEKKGDSPNLGGGCVMPEITSPVDSGDQEDPSRPASTDAQPGLDADHPRTPGAKHPTKAPLGRAAAIMVVAGLLTAGVAVTTAVLWPESKERTFARETLDYSAALRILMNKEEPEETRRKPAMFRAFILMRDAIRALRAVKAGQGQAANPLSKSLDHLRETLLDSRLLDNFEGAWRGRLRHALGPDIELVASGGSDPARQLAVAEQVELGFLALKTVQKEGGPMAVQAGSYLKKLQKELGR